MDSEGDDESPQSLSDEESTSLGVAADLDTQTGLHSPPAKRVKLSESPEIPPPSPPYEFLEGSGDGSSDEGSDSDDSFILDLFHAEGSGESPPGISICLSRSYEDDIKITKEERIALKTELRTIGGANFMRKYMQPENQQYTLKEILYAFGYILVHYHCLIILTVA